MSSEVASYVSSVVTEGGYDDLQLNGGHVMPSKHARMDIN